MKTDVKSEADLEKSVSLLGSTHALELQTLQLIKPQDIAVLPGQYDCMQKLLDAAKIPYTLQDAIGTAIKSKPRVLLLNCDPRYQHWTSTTGSELRGFVESGGRVVTTDWSLYAVMSAFPGHVNRGKQDIPDQHLRVKPHGELGQYILGSKFVKKDPRWYFENGSYTIESLQGKDTTALLYSDELKEQYGQSLVAFGIRFGDGELVHFTSHLDAQTKDYEKEGVATNYTSLHAMLRLCGRPSVLNPVLASDDLDGGKSISSATGSGKKAKLLTDGL